MLEFIRGNILTADTEALVNTVNCVGIMGKGIALQFKKAFPENFAAYRKRCEAGAVQTGKMFVFDTGAMLGLKYIINFPTKQHWRESSKYEYIADGLNDLVSVVRDKRIQSIAIPPLGCGNGGLDWAKVRPMIQRAFENFADVHVMVYEPAGAPDTASMPIGTSRPQLTTARALFLALMNMYTDGAYRLTLLEIQKLAYFMQECGQPLRLRYEKGHYGPYAQNLNKVLETLEGHYTQGYGDSQAPDVDIALLPGAAADAMTFLEPLTDESQRLRRVDALIEGFETPYGMELLASTHWLAVHETPPAGDVDEVIAGFVQWNERKQTIFRPDHIRIACERLTEQQWLPLLPD